MPSFDTSTPDYARLVSTLSNSRTQIENNALHQTILGTINAVQANQEGVDKALSDLKASLALLTTISIEEPDTSSAPVTLELSDVVNGMTVIKDFAGNASVNNITMNGTVEGVVNPVINTNFGIYRVYLSPADGLFHTW